MKGILKKTEVVSFSLFFSLLSIVLPLWWRLVHLALARYAYTGRKIITSWHN